MDPELIFGFIRHHVEFLSDTQKQELANMITGEKKKAPKAMTEEEIMRAKIRMSLEETFRRRQEKHSKKKN